MSLDRSNRFHRVADASGAVTLVALGAVLALGLLAERVDAQTFTRITTGAHVTDGGSSRSVNWVDIDGDRDLDLFVSNGPNPGQLAFLYRNDGAPNWTFTKITNDPIVLDAGRSDGASFADVDNDGDLDAEVATWYGDVDYFYLGDGAGGFTKVTTQPPATTGAFSESCSWGDYDGRSPTRPLRRQQRQRDGRNESPLPQRRRRRLHAGRRRSAGFERRQLLDGELGRHRQ